MVRNHSKRGVYISNSRGVLRRKGSTLAVKKENTNMAISQNKPYNIIFFLIFLTHKSVFQTVFFVGVKNGQ